MCGRLPIPIVVLDRRVSSKSGEQPEDRDGVGMQPAREKNDQAGAKRADDRAVEHGALDDKSMARQVSSRKSKDE